MKVALVWASFGPYHLARLKAVSALMGEKNAVGVQFSNSSQTYAWKIKGNRSGNLITVFEDVPAEQVSFLPLFFRLIKIFRREKIEVCFVPSYWPASSAAALFAAKLSGCKTVMMNESHGGTARSAGIKHLVKRMLLKMFEAALVGGSPQREYFHDLGFSDKNLFTGYDAVDNDYFTFKSDEIRKQKLEISKQYGLPKLYFLSLGRFVAKKNLVILIQAYQKLLASNRDCQTHLVMVGSGEEEPKLRALCRELRLPIYDKKGVGIDPQPSTLEHKLPGVHFYGFRQVEENPVFYALADAFILPSLWEEWGLVVNEAMASGLPVIVSKTAGCATDLVQEGVNGFTFDPGNVEQLAQLMRQISALKSFRLSEFGDASRKIISNWGCDVFAHNANRAAEAAIN